jgi:hypothetical protein
MRGDLKIMENKELKERFIDEKTGIEYIRQEDYYIPNLVLSKQKKIHLNKYGRMRLNYLKEHKKAEYTIMFMENTLIEHLEEIQETATKRVNQIINDLKAKSDLTENMKNTDVLYWVGTMNAIKQQAKEIVLKELIYV